MLPSAPWAAGAVVLVLILLAVGVLKANASITA